MIKFQLNVIYPEGGYNTTSNVDLLKSFKGVIIEEAPKDPDFPDETYYGLMFDSFENACEALKYYINAEKYGCAPIGLIVGYNSKGNVIRRKVITGHELFGWKKSTRRDVEAGGYYFINQNYLEFVEDFCFEGLSEEELLEDDDFVENYPKSAFVVRIGFDYEGNYKNRKYLKLNK